jgi:hypothetical protein
MVRNGYAVGVTAEVVKHILRTTKRWFGIDNPIFAKQRPEPRSEDLRLSEYGETAGKVQLPSLKLRLEPSDELAAKDAPEHWDGKKESGARPNPACAIKGEPARRDDAVDMRMKHAEEADLGAEISGVTGHCE